MFIVYEACIVYSHHLSMFLLFDLIIIDLIFSSYLYIVHFALSLSSEPLSEAVVVLGVWIMYI